VTASGSPASVRRGPAIGMILVLVMLLGAWWSWSGRAGAILAEGDATHPGNAAQTVSATAAYTVFLPLVRHYDTSHVMLYGAKVNGSPLSAAASLAQNAQVQWTRIELSWATVEPVNVSPDQYHWSTYDNTLRTLAQAGLRPIVTIGGNPSWAAATPCGPISPTHLVDFAEFMGALAARYGQPPYNVKHWELYNEPDNTDPVNYSWLGGCWGGHGIEYAEMLKVVYPVVKAADPHAQVVFGGLAYEWFTTDPNPGPFERGFMEVVVDPARGNAAAYFDAMNFHFYPPSGPRWEGERAPYDEKGIVAKSNYLRARLAAYGVTKPFICTETSMWSDPENGGSYELQSRYVAQAFARGMAANLDVVIWYCLTDYQAKWLYGLLHADLSPKPGYSAYQTLTSELPNVRFVRKLTVYDTHNEHIEGYEFEDLGTGKRSGVLWTNNETTYEMAFPVVSPGSGIRWVSMIAFHADGTPNPGSVHVVYDGGEGDRDSTGGQITILVGPDPIYVSAYP